MKICKQCNRLLNYSQFYPHQQTADRLTQQCKKCRNSLNSKWYFENKERCRQKNREYRIKNHTKVREYEKRYFDKNRPQILIKMREYIVKLKQHVYDMYGNKCACCGETNKEFFAMDHLDGGGTNERKRRGTRGIYTQALKPDFQKEKYQLLCHNCNMSLGFFGYCPHRPDIKRPVLKKFIQPT